MKFLVSNVLSVPPATFWERVFFDRDYNERLYQVLGFLNMQVLKLEERPDGTTQRVLRAEPRLQAPALVKAKFQGKFFYTEDGVYDPKLKLWTFRSVPSVASDQVSIMGTIRLSPHPRGAAHSVEVDARVTAWGLGALIERVIERNTRDNLAKTVRFIDQWAEERGLI